MHPTAEDRDASADRRWVRSLRGEQSGSTATAAPGASLAGTWTARRPRRGEPRLLRHRWTRHVSGDPPLLLRVPKLPSTLRTYPPPLHLLPDRTRVRSSGCHAQITYIAMALAQTLNKTNLKSRKSVAWLCPRRRPADAAPPQERRSPWGPVPRRGGDPRGWLTSSASSCSPQTGGETDNLDSGDRPAGFAGLFQQSPELRTCQRRLRTTPLTPRPPASHTGVGGQPALLSEYLPTTASGAKAKEIQPAIIRSGNCRHASPVRTAYLKIIPTAVSKSVVPRGGSFSRYIVVRHDILNHIVDVSPVAQPNK